LYSVVGSFLLLVSLRALDAFFVVETAISRKQNGERKLLNNKEPLDSKKVFSKKSPTTKDKQLIDYKEGSCQ
jgi:hypothetical protein